MAKQLFSDDGATAPGGANVCLHTGPDFKIPSTHLHRSQLYDDMATSRLGFVKWHEWNAEIEACLYAPKSPPPDQWHASTNDQGSQWLNFHLFPNFPCSLISQDVAEQFNLIDGQYEFAKQQKYTTSIYPSPLGRVLFPAVSVNPVSVGYMVQATIILNTHCVIDPIPIPARRPFEFFIPDNAPKKFGLFGRDVVNYMFLLYRGVGYRGDLIDCVLNRNYYGRLYFGGNEEMMNS